jgi:hypothetical protein
MLVDFRLQIGCYLETGACIAFGLENGKVSGDSDPHGATIEYEVEGYFLNPGGQYFIDFFLSVNILMD